MLSLYDYDNVVVDSYYYSQDGKKQEAESNILLASIENMQYVVTIDVLHEVMY